MKILFQMFCFLQNSYCPQTRFAKVMFSQVCICPLGEGGVCPIACRVIHTPPGPEADTPRARSTPPRQTPPGPEAPPRQTPLPLGRHPLWADTPPGQTPPSRKLPPPSSACFDTVTKQAVCIPLECILVDNVSLIN